MATVMAVSDSSTSLDSDRSWMSLFSRRVATEALLAGGGFACWEWRVWTFALLVGLEVTSKKVGLGWV